MKKQIHFLALIFYVACFLVGCKAAKDEKNVKITVHATNSKGQTVAVKSVNMLTQEQIILAETKFNTTGNASLQFELPNTQFATVQIGENANPVLLSPGDDLDISFDLKDSASNPIFKGKAAAATQYLHLSNLIAKKFEHSGGKYIYELPPADYAKRSDSLSRAYSVFHQSFLDTTKIAKTVCSLLENRNKMNVLWQKQNYVLSTFGAVKDSSEIPVFFRNTDNEIPFDTKLLKSNMGEYACVALIYVLTQSGNLYKGKSRKEMDEFFKILPVKNDEMIKKIVAPAEIKEYLVAVNLLQNIGNYGINTLTKQTYEDFLKNCKSKDYAAFFQKKYAQYDSLLEGKPAPNIVGVTPAGKKVSLTDFKGKIVYVDVWATWCGPCREELPKTRMIEKKYKNNNDVVFMYVSVDQEIEEWKKLLKKDKSFEGIQIHSEPDEHKKTVWESYLISGIPNYILIDQEGKIVSAKAARPSSGKLEPLIDQLLNKKNINSQKVAAK